MATYINYGEGEEDAVVQAAEWLRRVIEHQRGPEAENEFAEAFKSVHNVDDRNYDNFNVFELFVKYSDDVFACIPESRPDERTKEVESFYAVIFSLLLLFDEQESVNTATTMLSEILTSTCNMADLRLRLLMMLYNTYNLPTFEIRFKVFKCVVDYSAKAGMFDQVLPYLDYLDAWMADWEKYMTVADKRELFRDISCYMRNLNKRVESFQFLERYNMLLQGESEKVLAEPQVIEMTVQLLKDAIELPSVIQFDDILAYDSVKALGKSNEYKDLVSLCGVFLSGSVSDLREFHNKNKEFFEKHEFSYEDSLTKIRLLALATLAQGRSEIALAEVASTLEEKEENVEPWVVRAISEGVVDGRINQLERKVLVKCAFQRKFGKEEWSHLDTKLTQWIENLESVIKFIGEQKAMKEAAFAA